MSDEAVVTGDEGAAAADPVKNIKEEMNRKFGNINEQLKAQNDALMATLESIKLATAPKAPEPEADVDPILDPVKFKQQVKAEVAGELRRESATTTATQNEIARISAIFPEFGQDGSPASKLALEKFKALPPHEKGTPTATKALLLEVAAELGLSPVSARKQNQEQEEDFSMSGNSGGGGGSRRERRESAAKDLTPAEETFATLIGLDPKDPKTRKAMTETKKRDTWGKYR